MTATAPADESSRAALLRTLRNPQVRKVQLAFAGSTLGDWAFATAIVVWAFQDGGAVAVGAYQAARFILMTVAAPLGGAVADRMSRRRFMIVSNVLRALLIGGAASTVTLDGPALLVYALALLAALVGAPFRSAQAGLLPTLVDTPGDLTAANAVAGNLENVALFAGPALAGALIAATDVNVVFWLNVATFVWSILLLVSVRPVAPADVPDGAPGTPTGFWKDLGSGFALVARDRDLRSLALMSGSAGFAWGALTVFMVLLAIDVLETGPEGVGYLSATLGIATVVSGVLILSRVGKIRLGQGMVVGTLGWGLPLLMVAAFPSPFTAIAALAVIGLSDAWASLGFETIPQRIAPPAFVSRVYAATESVLIAPMALGALIAPKAADLIGLRASLAIAGTIVVVTALTQAPQMRRLDQRLTEPAELPLLRGIPIFSALPAPALERLAHSSTRTRVAAAEIVLAEGESSRSFYVIVSGQVAVAQAGRQLRTEGPGEFFGEIGLLRDVPRTATVTAMTDCELLVVDRADFLAAVSRLGEARSALDDVVSRRLSG